MKVRRATKSDVKDIVRFQKNMAYETEKLELDDAVLNKGVKAVFDTPEKGIYFVAENNEEIIASTLLTPEWSDWRNGFVYWIQSVYVLPKYRRTGVFSRLFDEVKFLMESSEEIKGLRLYVDKTNEKAIRVYEKMGMDGNHYRLFELMK